MPLHSPALFDRDLSWLSFNFRVLLEAGDTRLPLYERIKFLAIYSSNLDEFFRVRVAAHLSLIRLTKSEEQVEVEGDPAGLLEAIHTEVNRQQEIFADIFRNQILPELRENHIHLILGAPKEDIHKEYVETLFHEEIRVYLHPELLRKKKIIHFLRDDAMYISVKLRNLPRENSEETGLVSSLRIRYALVQIPTHYFPRFFALPKIDGRFYFMLLDDVIHYNLKNIFPGYEILECRNIRLSRNADLMIDDEYSGDLVEKIASSLKKRQIGLPARFLYDARMSKSMLKYLRATFSIGKKELLPGSRHHSFKDFFGFPNPVGNSLEKKPLPPVVHPQLEKYPTMVEAIREKNRVLHFPYHTYDYVIRFLNQAAIDPQVESIRATQYRVASNSAIVNALVRAAQNGKKVIVFVELKARFDEAANIASAKEMQEAGVKIIYSIPGLKVHAKVAMVTRKENGEKFRYAFLSTGNFNEKTARIYADHGFFTADKQITGELKELFFYLENRKQELAAFKKLMVAQFNLRQGFADLIDREIRHAGKGRKAEMFLKMNNLEDDEMIQKLYEASQAGVKIKLIIRGICCLRPGVEGLSENIRVIRLVDQFLEHARVFTFYNDGDPVMYLASADWMKRNLSRRIELAFPIEDPVIKREIMEIMRLQWNDNVKAVNLDSNLNNVPVVRKPGDPEIRAQVEAYTIVKNCLAAPSEQ